MAKHYNPFKMWGSYAGAIIGLPIYIIFTYNGSKIFYPITYLTRIFGNAGTTVGNETFAILFLTLPIIFGFLLGWGIHSLIRKLRK